MTRDIPIQGTRWVKWEIGEHGVVFAEDEAGRLWRCAEVHREGVWMRKWFELPHHPLCGCQECRK
jgi:hypothetical protein